MRDEKQVVAEERGSAGEGSQRKEAWGIKGRKEDMDGHRRRRREGEEDAGKGEAVR